MDSALERFLAFTARFGKACLNKACFGEACFSETCFSKASVGNRRARAWRVTRLTSAYLRGSSIALGLAWSLSASAIDVSSDQFVTLHQGDELTIEFNISNYGHANPGSPFPTSLELQFIATLPANAGVSSAPGSSQQFYSGYLLQGLLSSDDGKTQASWIDSLATADGLAAGDLLLHTGTQDGISQGIGLGRVNLLTGTSSSLFGTSAAFSGDARILLVNLGLDTTVGFSADPSLRYAITEPFVSGSGPVSVSGVTRSITFLPGNAPAGTPEPATWWMLGGGLGLFGLVARRRG